MRPFYAALLLGSVSFGTASALLLDHVISADPHCDTQACWDYEQHRITLDQYHQLIGVTPKAAAPARVQWAATVRAFSSQYSVGQWSANQVLGAPNAYTGGDNPNAWAPLTADGGPEFIEVGFAEPTKLAGLQIYESFNPGAVRLVELITASGKHVPYPVQGPVHELHFQCTGEDIVAARITLASQEVGGWNEIDAIGAVGCDSM